MAAPTFALQLGIWRFILEHLGRREPAALLFVAASTGHAPGKAGFKMAVDPSGRQCGTIGGGAIEHAAVAEARALLGMRRPLSRVSHKVHQPGHPDASGMNCGGSQTVAYVVIMTPDHRADELALRQVVRKRLRYLGVPGSARKAREMLEKLRATGCPPECLGRVHTPVGLPIASHTPAEIAISIAAQLIQERNRQDPPASGSGTESAGILENQKSL